MGCMFCTVYYVSLKKLNKTMVYMLGCHQGDLSHFKTKRFFLPSFKETNKGIIQTSNSVWNYSDGFLYLSYALFWASSELLPCTSTTVLVNKAEFVYWFLWCVAALYVNKMKDAVNFNCKLKHFPSSRENYLFLLVYCDISTLKSCWKLLNCTFSCHIYKFFQETYKKTNWS